MVIEFEPLVSVAEAESWREVEEFPAFVVVATWFTAPVVELAAKVP